MKSRPIVFFGSSQLSLSALKALATDFTIEAVITKPDTRLHGKTLSPPLVVWAKTAKIPYFQPANAQQLETLMQKPQRFSSVVGVVIDYGIIIPNGVIAAFTKGLVNSHFSLLPQWRGADPIRAAILSGQTKTGVSLMLIEPELDAGHLLAQAELVIASSATAPSLTKQLLALNNRLLPATLIRYLAGKIIALPQSTDQVPTYTRKLAKADGRIDWTKPAEHLEREVRAYQGWPGSSTRLATQMVSVTKVHTTSEHGPAGKIFTQNGQLGVYCGQAALIIDRLKPAGKREMKGSDWLHGHKQLINPLV